MRRTHRYIASLFLTATLVAPVSIFAATRPQDNRDQSRVYDKEHKDYHNWDDNENKAWDRYQTDKHIKSHDFTKANQKEQANYWKWRHEHPDKD